VQENHGRERGHKRGPNKNPHPADRHCNGVKEHIAVPPFPFAGLRNRTAAPSLKARGANVFLAQLQVTQRAHEPAAPWQQAWNDLSGWKKHVAWSESAAAA